MNRLEKVMSRVVSNFQNTFLERRLILDVVFITSKAIDSWLKSSFNGVLCKFDIEKVYDHVNLDFLLRIMGKMGFGQK